MAWTGPLGAWPSVKSKLCSVVSAPLGVILKTTPQPPEQVAGVSVSMPIFAVLPVPFLEDHGASISICSG